MSINMVYTEFTKDLATYLQGKLPDLPPYTAQEIGTHIGNKVMILVNDMMREYDRELKWAARKRTYRRENKSAMEEI